MAYLEQHRFGQAEEQFRKALAIDPDYLEARIDLAIALAAAVEYEPALAELDRALALDADHPTALYMKGLIHKYRGEQEDAIAAFEKVHTVDPHDTDTKYNLATSYKDSGQIERAIPLLEEVIAAAPHFASAYYALGQAYMRLGMTAGDATAEEKGRAAIARFQELSGGTSAETHGLRYGEQGRYAMGVEDGASEPPPPPAAIEFTDVADERGLAFTHRGGGLGGGALFYDLDADGDDDILLLGAADGSAVRLFRNDAGKLTDVTGEVGLDGVAGELHGVAAGDVDDDSRTELVLGGKLYRVDEGGTYAATPLTADTASVGFVDLDHDGDLDVVATLAEGGLATLVNDGAGEFTRREETGLAAPAAAVGLTWSDLDLDRDIDGVVTTDDGAPLLFSNKRDLSFAERGADAGLTMESSRGVAAGDLNRDGWPDLVIATGKAGAQAVLENTRDGRFAPLAAPSIPAPASTCLLVDVDLDGDLDVLFGHEAGLTLLRNDGAGALEDVTSATGLDAVDGDVRGLAAGDLDGDGDPDLVGNRRGGSALLLLNRGAEDRSWIKVDARGLSSNSPGFGTKIDVRAGRLHQKLEVTAASGFLSQSSRVTTFGLRAHESADRVRLLWPGGVLQAEIDRAARETHAIEELDRKGSSCPFLWSWNGERIEFISDIQGGSPLGLWVAPGVRNLPDSDEWFLIPSDQVALRDGAYDLRITESLEEVTYIDRAMLRVVDAPTGVRVFPNERLLLMPPFAEYGLHFVTSTRAPERVVDAAGDAKARVADIDRRYAGAGARTRFRGIAEPWQLEIDFGRVEAAPGRRLLLLAHGWVEFSNSTPMYAASQAGVHVAPPQLDLLGPSGAVHSTIADAGAPAGLPKWMVLDLTDHVPSDGTVRLRYRTNMEVYFDQILLGETDPDTPHTVTDVEADTANLSWTGYPTLWSPDDRRPQLYRYDELLREETWQSQEGLYTRFGDVRELVREADDLPVVMSHGDELALRFAAADLPALDVDRERHLILFTIGYAKDLDRMSAVPDSVGPLPYRSMPSYPYAGRGPLDRSEFARRLAAWNTRYVRPSTGTLR